MNPARWPEGLLSTWNWALLAAGIGSLVFVARSLVRSDVALEEINPLNLPLIVALGAVLIETQWWSPPTGGQLFAYAFVYGLMTGLLAFSFFRPVRDAALSVVSVGLIVPVLAQRWEEGPRLVVVLLLLSLLAGLVLLLFTLGLGKVPVLGIGLLAAVDILDFLLSPFGLPFSEYTSSQATLLSMIGAALLGVGAAIRPRLVVGLGVTSIFVGQLFFTLCIWAANQNGDLLRVTPDWSGWITMAGCFLGWALTAGFWAQRA